MNAEHSDKYRLLRRPLRNSALDQKQKSPGGSRGLMSDAKH